jgi:hypothetical protein
LANSPGGDIALDLETGAIRWATRAIPHDARTVDLPLHLFPRLLQSVDEGVEARFVESGGFSIELQQQALAFRRKMQRHGAAAAKVDSLGHFVLVFHAIFSRCVFSGTLDAAVAGGRARPVRGDRYRDRRSTISTGLWSEAFVTVIRVFGTSNPRTNT